MSRRALIDDWVAGCVEKERATGRRAGEHLVASDVVASLTAAAADESRAPATRRRELGAARRLARELAAAGELSGVELAAVLAVPGPPATQAERRVPLDALKAIAAARALWPDSPLRTSSAIVAIVLNSGAGMLLEHAAELRWSDLDLSTGIIADGRQVPAMMRDHLIEHRQLIDREGGSEFVLPALVGGRGTAALRNPARPTSKRTLQHLVAAVRVATQVN